MQLPFRNPKFNAEKPISIRDGLGRPGAATTASASPDDNCGEGSRAPARNKLVVLAGVANALGRPPRSRLLAERSRRQRTPVRR